MTLLLITENQNNSTNYNKAYASMEILIYLVHLLIAENEPQFIRANCEMPSRWGNQAFVYFHSTSNILENKGLNGQDRLRKQLTASLQNLARSSEHQIHFHFHHQLTHLHL